MVLNSTDLLVFLWGSRFECRKIFVTVEAKPPAVNVFSPTR